MLEGAAKLDWLRRCDAWLEKPGAAICFFSDERVCNLNSWLDVSNASERVDTMQTYAYQLRLAHHPPSQKTFSGSEQ